MLAELHELSPVRIIPAAAEWARLTAGFAAQEEAFIARARRMIEQDMFRANLRAPAEEFEPEARQVVMDMQSDLNDRIWDVLGDRVDYVAARFSRLGVQAELVHQGLDAFEDFLAGIEAISPAALVGAFAGAVRGIVSEMLRIVSPTALLGQMFGELATMGRNLLSSMNPISILFQAISGAMNTGLRDAIEQLAPVIAKLAALVASALAPVLEALTPIIAELTPVIVAVVQVFAVLFTAITPILRALVPLLVALFPIFQQVAIAATYIGQIFFISASLILRVVAFFVGAVGAVVATLGHIINAITPFANPGNPLVRAGETLQGVARGMRGMAEGFYDASKALGDARDEIRAIKIGEALDPIARLGDAAYETAEALFNVPYAYRKLGQRRWQAMEAFTPAVAQAAVSYQAAQPSVPTAAPAQVSSQVHIEQHINAREYTPREIARAALTEFQNQARAQFGDTGMWQQVQTV
jgi:hypothetical protein